MPIKLMTEAFGNLLESFRRSSIKAGLTFMPIVSGTVLEFRPNLLMINHYTLVIKFTIIFSNKLVISCTLG